MKRSVFAQTLVIIAVIVAASPAFALVTAVFEITPGAITEGESADLALQVSVTADPGYFNAQFTGGTLTLESGNGASQTFAGATTGTSQSDSQSFSYAAKGSFSPSYVYSLTYDEAYNYYGILYEQTYTYIAYYSSYSYGCGFAATCYGSYPVYGYYNEPVYGYLTGELRTGEGGSGFSSLTVNAAVPEPSTWALMLLGFTGLGFAGYRHAKRKDELAFVE